MRTSEDKKANESEIKPTIQKVARESMPQLVDNRPEAIAQRKLQEKADNSPQAQKLAQLQAKINGSPTKESSQNEVIQPKGKTNHTGLPDQLKSGIENLSGISMDDVKVHRNSSEPAQLNAHAYAQGTNIHLGPGQEKHLAHEAWHVIQQKQGRVKPTIQMKGKVNVNDDKHLEREADVMGKEALKQDKVNQASIQKKTSSINQSGEVIQAWFWEYNGEKYIWHYKRVDEQMWKEKLDKNNKQEEHSEWGFKAGVWVEKDNTVPTENEEAQVPPKPKSEKGAEEETNKHTTENKEPKNTTKAKEKKKETKPKATESTSPTITTETGEKSTDSSTDTEDAVKSNAVDDATSSTPPVAVKKFVKSSLIHRDSEPATASAPQITDQDVNNYIATHFKGKQLTAQQKAIVKRIINPAFNYDIKDDDKLMINYLELGTKIQNSQLTHVVGEQHNQHPNTLDIVRDFNIQNAALERFKSSMPIESKEADNDGEKAINININSMNDDTKDESGFNVPGRNINVHPGEDLLAFAAFGGHFLYQEFEIFLMTNSDKKRESAYKNINAQKRQLKNTLTVAIPYVKGPGKNFKDVGLNESTLTNRDELEKNGMEKAGIIRSLLEEVDKLPYGGNATYSNFLKNNPIGGQTTPALVMPDQDYSEHLSDNEYNKAMTYNSKTGKGGHLNHLMLRDQSILHTIEKGIQKNIKLMGYGEQHVKAVDKYQTHIEGNNNLKVYITVHDFINNIK